MRALELQKKKKILSECVTSLFGCWHFIGSLITHYIRADTRDKLSMLFPAILNALYNLHRGLDTLLVLGILLTVVCFTFSTHNKY